MTISITESAERLVNLLADAATHPGHPGYMTQTMLMGALRIQARHTFNDIVTKAAILAPAVISGSAIAYNSKDGYRLVDRQTQRDLRVERGRARSAKTKIERLATGFLAQGNGPILRLIGRQLMATVATVVEPMLCELDEVIGVDAA